jgi:DNA-binding MarR family transcriptional regulator
MSGPAGNSRRNYAPFESGAQAELFRFIRHSHIFSSAVREILESKLIREASPFPLTASQFHILKVMALNGPLQLGELADFLGVSGPATTKNIDKLERLGLVLRSASTGDRRVTLISLSRAGRRVVDKYERLKTARLGPVLATFKARELEMFASLLERFSVSLLQNETSRREFCLRCNAYIESNCPVARVRGGCPYQMSRQGRAQTEATTGTRSAL